MGQAFTQMPQEMHLETGDSSLLLHLLPQKEGSILVLDLYAGGSTARFDL